MKRSPLKPRSARRIREDAEFVPIRKAAFARDGRCMAPLAWGRCWGGWEAHHIVSRARDHTLLLVLDNLTTLCFVHHQYVHDHPFEAAQKGLLKSA